MSVLTFDRAGVVISTLCIVHCVLLPVAASVLPMAGLLAENEMFHKILVFMAILPAAVLFSKVSRSRFSLLILGLGGLGILMLVTGAFVESFHDYETPLTLIGAFSLASAHLWRSSLLKAHPHQN